MIAYKLKKYFWTLGYEIRDAFVTKMGDHLFIVSYKLKHVEDALFQEVSWNVNTNLLKWKKI